MSGWRARLVPVIAVLSVVASGITLIASSRAGHPLPVQTINVTVLAAGAALMAVVLHRRTPDNNLWRVLLVVAVVGPIAVTLFAVADAQSHPSEPLVAAMWLLDVPLAIPWMLFVGLFPDGHRPIPRWPELVWVGGTLLAVVSVVAWITAPDGSAFPVPGHMPGVGTGSGEGTLHAASAQLASALAGLLVIIAAGCLIYRYRRSGPVVRQQIRVGAAGLATSVVLEVALRTLPGVDDPQLQLVVAVIAVGVGGFAVAAALLRWRLWIVDQALPRAVVLGAFSAAATILIVVSAMVASGGIGPSQVQGAVVAAVVVTVLVQGYSRRLEPAVRRWVYGERPGGFAVLIGLADGLTSLDEQAAATRTADAARRGLAVPWAALWAPTAREGVFRLSSTVGDVATGQVAQFPPERQVVWPTARLLTATDIRSPLPEDTAAVSQLSSDAGCWGLLAVGQRRGDPLTVGDVELLTAIVREAELAHANRQLQGEVAASMEELRARARELQESRQRLVAAQDEERRRIERDLHDGAQHDLIALAGRLRQLAQGREPTPDALVSLAEQAEQAVFTLQDLARGIYPSILTDHGVASAIRSYVGRLPVDIALSIRPELARRRWPAELEVALYFVAVESLGNSRKHAAAAAVTVTLAEQGGQVVLEIHDDGPGFDPDAVSRSSGLQHMADRMAAVGGSLEIVSRPRDGTWVIAKAPSTSAEAGSDGLSRSQQTRAGTAAPLGLGG